MLSKLNVFHFFLFFRAFYPCYFILFAIFVILRKRIRATVKLAAERSSALTCGYIVTNFSIITLFWHIFTLFIWHLFHLILLIFFVFLLLLTQYHFFDILLPFLSEVTDSNNADSMIDKSVKNDFLNQSMSLTDEISHFLLSNVLNFHLK